MKPLLILDLGLISYTDGVALQQRIVEARKAQAVDDVLLLCQHPHVLTLGRNGKRENLLASEHVLRQKGVEFHASNRGGDITYHGPGQIVGYPILDLAKIKQDVHWYVRTLEEVMIRISAEFGIAAYRIPGKTGIWVQATPHEEKLAAIGVHISRWVTSHGFAYNVATDLRYFDLIVPCGIAERKATSLEKLLDRVTSQEEVKSLLIRHFVNCFNFAPQSSSAKSLLSGLTEFENSLRASQSNVKDA
jgi:lipoyl(octanoyl) transferase